MLALKSYIKIDDTCAEENLQYLERVTLKDQVQTHLFENSFAAVVFYADENEQSMSAIWM